LERNNKNACKEIELMQQEKANLDHLSINNTKLLQEIKRLCKENRNLEVQNTNLKNLKKEPVLVREN